MKDHVKRERYLSIFDMEGTVDEVVAHLRAEEAEVLKAGAVNPAVTIEFWYDDFELKLTWWQPLSDEEIAKKEEKRRKDRERQRAKRAAKKAKTEAEELAELARLREKYE